jgi:hypothetical protein
MTTKSQVNAVDRSNAKQHSSELAKSLSLMAKSLSQRPQELRGVHVASASQHRTVTATAKLK